ncbi:fimbrial protein (plasmid) [Enterobacter sp. JS8-1]|uniref:fimbrial protein n=1 Tax=Enterobacter sp. JS8-1 TaxID=3411633 RepID=UPI003B9EAA41
MSENIIMFRFIRAMFVALVGLISYSVNAACYTNQGGASPQSQTISPGVINVQRDLAVGSVIATYTTATTGTALSCTAGTSADGFYMGMVLFTSLSNISHVYQTNVAGIGVRVYSAGGNFDSPATFVSFLGPGSSAFGPRTIDFVKTGNIIPGNLNSGLLARIYGNGDGVTAVSYNLNSTQVNQLACSITTPNLTFPIGDVLASNFGQTVGTIPSGAQNTQSLGLNCDAGANINVMLQGTQNPDVSTTSVLALTGQGNADVATGVGVQLLYNSTPLVLNSRIMLKQSTGGAETFPITARYYQTNTAVTTGKANATATLDLTYQ